MQSGSDNDVTATSDPLWPRPEHPTIAQLRQVCQPPEITQRGSAEHWTGDLYMRRISLYLTRPLIRLGFSANGVTWLMITAGVLSGFALLIPGVWGPLLAALLIQLQMLLDCCDGETARWRRTSSAAGVFLDSVGHFSAEASLCLGLGIRASGGIGAPTWWLFAGGFVAVMVLINRGMNEMVRSARYRAELPKLPDAVEVNVSNSTGVRSIKSAARVFPVHKMLHSIELSLIILFAGVLDLFTGDLLFTRILLAVLVPATVLVCGAHLAAIMTSNRLR